MYQKITIVGNLGQDPEMKYTPSGTAVTNFSVATNRSWTNQDGSKGEETVWFRVAAWRRQAETCNEYLSKGRQVLVEGRLRPANAWIGRDGEARASLEITAQTVKFLGKANGQGQSSAPEPEEQEEVPF